MSSQERFTFLLLIVAVLTLALSALSDGVQYQKHEARITQLERQVKSK